MVGTMKLSELIRNQIDKDIRSDGMLHTNLNHVLLSTVSDNQIKSKVKSSDDETYDVSIDINNETITVECTCPYFQSDGACKHIWATILTAERDGFESKSISHSNILICRNENDHLINPPLEEQQSNEPGKPEEYIQQSIDGIKDEKGDQNIYQFTRHKPSSKKWAADWKSLFTRSSFTDDSRSSKNKSSVIENIYYEIDSTNHVGLYDLRVYFKTRKIRSNGEPGPSCLFDINGSNINQIANQTDRQILSMIRGSITYNYVSYTSASLNQTMAELVFPMILGTQRCTLAPRENQKELSLHFDESKKWELSLSLERDNDGYLLSPKFTCDYSVRTLDDTAHINSTGYVIWKDGTVNPLDAHGLYSWIQNFLIGTYTVPAPEVKSFILSFKELQDSPPFTYPDDLDIPEIELEPKLIFRIQGESEWRRTLMFAELHFIYDDMVFTFGHNKKFIYDSDRNKLYRVNYEFHNHCLQFLQELGIREDPWNHSILNFHRSRFQKIIQALLAQGWHVEGKNLQFKKPGNFSFSVNSGIDWFEVQGSCDYDGEVISVPEILNAVKMKKDFIELSNGGVGLLPTEWLEKYSHLAAMGTTQNDAIRFKKSQALFIDLLLAEQPDLKCDDVFTSIRNSLHEFTGILPEKASGNFCGNLRNYQEEGLGWLSFLNKFGFGGCLADDMGLGKTIQVLAILEKLRLSFASNNGRKKEKKALKPQPSLVVAPRSLIYNWSNEASKFTPELKVLDNSHSQRSSSEDDFTGYDLILVTYGTLRRDIDFLRKIQFNYIILDEAQTIKNASTATSKAARLLNGTNRLALSGTPVENHLSDLWSIFEFLNPGILGSVTVFKETTKSGSLETGNCELLRKALRPFILRRTKTQVALDLPLKTEEVIFCEMEPAQRKQYNQLKQYYQESLKNKISETGLNRSKIQILEALLRLRQAACHPGLIDNKHIAVKSAKVETLIAQLLELKEEGHKSLVFSQFTSMLAIIGEKLTNAGITYEYLDGKTTNRQQVVNRFQDDTDCSTFLISLKAGGVGLNITAADYVFIFDPWWNPAAEMQAIDRTHRIGQTKPVFAYRLICKDTVEEKIMQLQKSKRSLAESVITTDESILSSITTEELELLLS